MTSRVMFLCALAMVASVLSGTILMPAVRPLMAWVAPGNDSAVHAFMALNLLGGILGAPLCARLGRRFNHSARFIACLALGDALLLLLCGAGLPLGALLAVRTAQGALNVGALSLLMGQAPLGSGGRSGAQSGIFGTAIMVGVALGAPLGTALLPLGPRAPLFTAVLLEILVALVVGRLSFALGNETAAPLPSDRLGERQRLDLSPALWVGLERFAIGCFVVTFALHCRSCLGRSDVQAGQLMSAFLLPFVLTVYPAGRLGDRLAVERLAQLGLTGYGLGFLALPYVSAAGLVLLMPVLGVSSALVFAAALKRALHTAGAQGRVQAMACLNSAGNLGMFLGTAVSGIVSALARARGLGPQVAHQLVFGMAGVAQLIGVLALRFGAVSPVSERARPLPTSPSLKPGTTVAVRSVDRDK
jgi:MFS family permease